MTRWIALSRTHHRDARYLPREGYAHASHDRVAPVLLSELGKLLPHYALAFIRHEGETFLPVALLGLAPGHNLYLNHDHRWLADYVPAALRGFPFALGATGDEDSPGKAVLSVREDHLLTAEQGGEPLMTEEGELTASVAQLARFLQHCQHDRQRTLAATRMLAEAELLEPWPLKVQAGADADPITLSGLYRLNHQRLDGLSVEAFSRLQGAPMALAYAQHFSVSNVDQLSRRAAYHAQRAAGEPPEDLDALFSTLGDDDFELDFDR